MTPLQQRIDDFLSSEAKSTAGPWVLARSTKVDQILVIGPRQPSPNFMITPDLKQSSSVILAKFDYEYYDAMLMVAAKNMAPQIIRDQQECMRVMRETLETLKVDHSPKSIWLLRSQENILLDIERALAQVQKIMEGK